jgi:hypothetical protein
MSVVATSLVAVACENVGAPALAVHVNAGCEIEIALAPETLLTTFAPIVPPTSPASDGSAAQVVDPATVVSTCPFVPDGANCEGASVPVAFVRGAATVACDAPVTLPLASTMI